MDIMNPSYPSRQSLDSPAARGSVLRAFSRHPSHRPDAAACTVDGEQVTRHSFKKIFRLYRALGRHDGHGRHEVSVPALLPSDVPTLISELLDMDGDRPVSNRAVLALLRRFAGIDDDPRRALLRRNLDGSYMYRHVHAYIGKAPEYVDLLRLAGTGLIVNRITQTCDELISRVNHFYRIPFYAHNMVDRLRQDGVRDAVCVGRFVVWRSLYDRVWKTGLRVFCPWPSCFRRKRRSVSEAVDRVSEVVLVKVGVFVGPELVLDVLRETGVVKGEVGYVVAERRFGVGRR